MSVEEADRAAESDDLGGLEEKIHDAADDSEAVAAIVALTGSGPLPSFRRHDREKVDPDPEWLPDGAIDRVVGSVGIPMADTALGDANWRRHLADQLFDALDATWKAFKGRTDESALREAYVRERENEFLARTVFAYPRDYWVQREPEMADRRERRRRRFASDFDEVRTDDSRWRRPPRRPLEYELDLLVERLGGVWQEFYQQPLKASYSGATGDATGPLVRFVRQCALECAGVIRAGRALRALPPLEDSENVRRLIQAILGMAHNPEAVRHRLRKVAKNADGPAGVVPAIERYLDGYEKRRSRGCTDDCRVSWIGLRVIAIGSRINFDDPAWHDANRSRPEADHRQPGRETARTQ